MEKLQTVPVSSWNYIGQDAKQFRHYGPMAQDFFAAFGHDTIGMIGIDKTLTGSDVEGILMISIQALYELSLEKDKQIEQLTQEIDELRQQLKKLQQAVEALSKK